MSSSDKKRGGKICNASDMLDAIFKTDEAKANLAKYQVIAHWSEIVGDTIANQAMPVKVRGDELIVEVVNTIWMNELHLQSSSILAKASQMFPGHGLKKIRFYPEKKRQKLKRESLTVLDKRKLDVELDDEEVQSILSVIDEIEDDALRESLWGFFYMNAQFNKGSKTKK